MAAQGAVAAAGHPLDALEQALGAERKALLEHDVELLLSSTAAKLVALRRAEGMPQDVSQAGRLSELRDLNQANGVLLARRRREVTWALRRLGRTEPTGVYDSTGQSSASLQARCLGVG